MEKIKLTFEQFRKLSRYVNRQKEHKDDFYLWNVATVQNWDRDYSTCNYLLRVYKDPEELASYFVENNTISFVLAILDCSGLTDNDWFWDDVCYEVFSWEGSKRVCV